MSRRASLFFCSLGALVIMMSVGIPVLHAGSMDLAWDPVSHPDLAGYRVYYGTASGNYPQSVNVGLATSSSLSGITDCATQYIAIRSVAVNGAESAGISNEIGGWPRPSISGVTPQQIGQGQSAALVVTGNNFKPDSTLEFDDPTVRVLSIQVDSCTQITAQVEVGLSAPAGSLAFDVVHGDRVYGSSTDLLTVIADTTALVPSGGWSVAFVSSEKNGNSAVNAIDGDSNSFWHTQVSGGAASHPHEIQIDLGGLYDIGGARFLPRQDGSVDGRIADYQLYLSATAGNWGAAVSSGTLEDRADLQRVDAVASSVRYLRLVVTSEVNGQPWTSLAEVQVEGVASALPNQPPDATIGEPSSSVTREVGQIVIFSATGSDPEDGTPTQWLWDFGDPSIPDSTVQNPGGVTFTAAGVYTVTLTVTDSEGLQDPTPATVTLTIVDVLEAASNLRRTDVKSD